MTTSTRASITDFKGKKTGSNFAAWQQLSETKKESPWGAGSVQIESTCWI